MAGGCGSQPEPEPTPIAWKTPAAQKSPAETGPLFSTSPAREQPAAPIKNSEAIVADPRPSRIRAYFGGLPLADIADVMVTEADQEGVDWRLAVVIGMLESTGGKYACHGTNAWGINSCGSWFDTLDDGARVVIDLLGQPPYRDQPLEGKLCVWVNGGHWPDCAEYVGKAMGELARLGER